MNPLIKITEVTKNIPGSDHPVCLNELKITNVSSQYLNNLKLVINPDDACILEQFVRRERGSLAFAPDTTCLELGNLAPDESAYFEYKFTSKPNQISLTPNFSLIYTDENHPAATTEKKIADLLSDSAI